MKGTAADPAAWVEYAEEDIRLARLALGATPAMPRGACFHAQQCAEKYLKGFLVAHGETVPRVHDLDFLNDLCARHDPEFKRLEGACNALAEFGAPVRYPAQDAPPPGEAQAGRAIALAIEIAEFIRERLKHP